MNRRIRDFFQVTKNVTVRLCRKPSWRVFEMIDSELKEQINKFGSESNIEVAKLFYEFKYKTVMEAATKLTQFSLIFFSVSTFITAISAFTSFDEKTRIVVLYSMSIMVVVFSIIGASIMYGVITGLIQIRDTLRSISLDTYNNLRMDDYFRRGIVVLFIVAITSITGVIGIIVVIFYVA